MSSPPEPAEATRAPWQVSILLRFDSLPQIEAALEPLADAVLTEAVREAHPLEHRPDDTWRLRAIAPDRASAARIAKKARRLLALNGLPTDQVDASPLPDIDWAAHVEHDQPPVRLGRFLVHASHHAVDPLGHVALRIEAGIAFGSGRHPTTQGCLRLIERTARRGFRVRRALDLGTGSGILAVAIATLWRRPVIASDIDPHAVLMSAAAAKANHVARWIRPALGRCLEARTVRDSAPYDLICANILAGPLVSLAPGLCRVLAGGGLLILSGILTRQESAVLAAYRVQGLALKRRVVEGEWTTLALGRGPRRAGWP
ncbi:MAG: 50S ribosomal protein L11 methyltransferase [Alphaproteobacteria bacterium]